jgi:hypothetical protein
VRLLETALALIIVRPGLPRNGVCRARLCAILCICQDLLAVEHPLRVHCISCVKSMPRSRAFRAAAQPCEHAEDCTCYKVSTGTEQTLEELDFARSACAAAQLGDMAQLKRLLARNPRQIHGAGAFSLRT